MNEQNQKENQAEKLTDFGFSKVKETDKEKQVKAVFDQVAPKYDLMNDVLSFGMHRLWKQYAIDRAEIRSGMKVLDIAGGTGDMSLLVQKKLSGTGEVWLSDINHEMLKIGDERLKNAGYHPYVLTCDAEYLPFPDGYFDVLIVSFGLRNMTHKDRALKEMQRVLKPGGRLMVLEFSKPNALMRPFYDFYSFKVMPFLSAKIAGHSENYRYLAESIRMHPDQKTLAKIMREAGIEVLCLDECHHLRSEWWKALEEFKKQVNNLKIIALTATPPYDSTPAMWTRYMNMCGEIDEEITIPELVKEGSLCPHQDYVYFNYPTKEEEKEVRRFEERSKAMTEKIMRDTQFLTYVRSHKGFSGQLSDDLLLDNPAYLASLLIYLQSKNIAIPSRLQRLLGAKKLPDMNVQWMERLLQGFLYDDVDSYLCDKTYRELLIADLKSDGLIEKKKVVMTKSAAVEKMLTNSLGKCNSIRDIVFHEYEASGQDLRLLVLTDYIRKEYEKAIGNTEYDVNSLGVLPFFEMLRRDNEKKNEQIRFGVLCGTIVIIPAEAREALEQAIGMSGKVTFSRIGNLSETDYLKVTAVGNAHFLTGAVTDIFSKGYMQVLIGTKSLLGEGWDSPCINSLILASFVGSFMLSNQMRGRAIRVMKEHPEKTSNIWHLVCLRPWNEVLKADDNQISEDYSMLERRMEHFLGLHYTENTIENGMKRLSVIKTPFNKTNIDRINRQMLKMSGQRDTLKERWNSALAVYDKMDIVDETEVKDKFVTSVVFWDAILTMILSGILCLIGAIGAGIVAASSQNGILAGTCYFFIAAGLAGIMIRFPKIFMLGSPLKRLKAFGNGIRKALEEQQLLEETHCKVETESNGPDNHIIYLSGGSGRDKALFAQCVNEFFDVIDNQRYILVKKKGHKGLNGFYAIPNCFSKKKEDAERFAKCMHPYIGNYDCVYTRNEKGRELLLEGRVKALANREERCISHKKVKGALE